MERKKGSKNKAVLEQAPTAESIINDLPVLPAFDLVLGIRRIRSGNFIGLWELTKLAVDPKDVEVIKVLSDANLKRLIISKASQELTKCI